MLVVMMVADAAAAGGGAVMMVVVVVVVAVGGALGRRDGQHDAGEQRHGQIEGGLCGRGMVESPKVWTYEY